MYENIVVAYDGSESSKAALIESVNWVKKHSGKVSLVHAVYFNEEELTMAPEQREMRFEQGKKLCYQTREMASSELGIDVETLVCEGDPPEVVADIARERSADLIAMGTHGRKGLKRLLMGSVTREVIIKSPCDVLVVKRSCSDCTGQFLSILVPFDGSDLSKKALDRACRIAGPDNSEVTVLYVIPRYEEMMEFFRTEAIEKGLVHEAKKILSAAAEEISQGLGISVKTRIEEGNAADKVLEISQKLETDLIVMGTHGWTGVNKAILGSTTERVITNATRPILVVR
ncbi:MAG: universal stress protein [Thermodesulfovibrionales bacterium]|jgi:nucleotide-binding universal stress UspA family protein